VEVCHFVLQSFSDFMRQYIQWLEQSFAWSEGATACGWLICQAKGCSWAHMMDLPVPGNRQYITAIRQEADTIDQLHLESWYVT
jgi:hypothetical protein